MTIIESYDNLSQSKIASDENIRIYREHIESYMDTLEKYRLRKENIVSILSHPITAVKGRIELGRVEGLSKNFESVLSRSIVSFMYEETGDLEVDLEEACKYYKPKYIREFMLNNPVEKPKSLKVSKKRVY
mgnify:FL=1